MACITKEEKRAKADALTATFTSKYQAARDVDDYRAMKQALSEYKAAVRKLARVQICGQRSRGGED